MYGLLEILTTKLWMVMPEYIHGSRAIWEQNLNGRIALDLQQKRHPYAMQMQDGRAVGVVSDFQVTEEGEASPRSWMDEMDAPFVNIMPVNGPITRDGGACSYGSKDLRDWLMQAANYDFCKAHVFVINSPGGSAWAINDFKQAIVYAHERGQKVYAFVDGLCASAAMYLASQCDEVYYMHPKNQFGSIGVMAAFYTEKNGTVNKYTNETYHELYDPESFDKNKWYRDIADDVKNDTELMDDLTKTGVEFRADIRKAFPAAEEKHIHGALFDADEVKGILCDGQMTLIEVVNRAFEVANGDAQPIERVTPVKLADDVPPVDPAPADPSEEASTPAVSTNRNNINQNNINMKQYKNIATACGVDELVVSEEGAHFVPQMLDALDQTLADQASAQTAHDEQVQTLQAQLTEAQNAITAAVESREQELNAAHKQAINDLGGQHEQAIKTEREARQSVEQQRDNLQAQLAEAQQTLRDQEARIAELTNAPSAHQESSPSNNGLGVQLPAEPKCAMPAYDPTKSPLANARIRKEAMSGM